LLGALGVVPKLRVLGVFFVFGNFYKLLIDVKDTPLTPPGAQPMLEQCQS
jgi:hypothetical protein